MNRRILGVFMAAVAVLFGLQLSMERLFTRRLQEMTQTMADGPAVETEIKESPRLYAIFGIDQQEGDAGRSDCILLASLSQDGTLKLCSIARDTLVTLPETGQETKLAHAYAEGGPELALKTINESFNLNVQDYVSVNFGQMESIVDLLGGVKLPLTRAEWTYMGYQEPYLGQKRLSGEEALSYSRIRSIDSDDVRTARQRKLIAAMVQEIESPMQLPELVAKGMKLCRTNVKLLDAMRLAKTVLTRQGEIETVSMALPGETVSAWGGTRKDGVWYYVYDLEQASAAIGEFFGLTKAL